MADGPHIPEEAKAFASLLSQADDRERQRLLKMTNQLAVAAAPSDLVGKPPVRTIGEYLDTEIETPPYVINPGIIVRGGITSLTARGGKGKTAFCLNALVRWAMGKPMFDARPDELVPDGGEPIKALILENEGSGGHFQKIVRKIIYNNAFTPNEIEMARENLWIWGEGGWSGLKLDKESDEALVQQALQDIQPDILFLEPFRGLWKGNENDSTEMANVLDTITGFAETYGAGVLLTHHERKSGVGEDGDQMSASRGSGALEGAAGVMFRWKEVKGGHHRELNQVKWRYDEPIAPIRTDFDFEKYSYTAVSEDKQEREVLAVLAGNRDAWMTVADVAEETGETKDRCRTLLNRLSDDDRVKRKRFEGGNRYRMTGADDSDGMAI